MKKQAPSNPARAHRARRGQGASQPSPPALVPCPLQGQVPPARPPPSPHVTGKENQGLSPGQTTSTRVRNLGRDLINAGLCAGRRGAQLGHCLTADHRDIVRGERGLGGPFSLHGIPGKNTVPTQGERCKEGISSSQHQPEGLLRRRTGGAERAAPPAVTCLLQASPARLFLAWPLPGRRVRIFRVL